MRMSFQRRADGGVLIFDIECRPTAWIGGDYVGRSLTAYAIGYLDRDEIENDAILPGDREHFELMMIRLAAALESADLVVGHYIRGFDLPVVNADLERVFQKSLPRMMALDTKIDRLQGLGLSESLENLSARYKLDTEKMTMHEPWWEEFNLWQTPETRKLVMQRNRQDVQGTKELYLALESAGRLKAPKPWDPANAKLPRYRA